MNKIIRKAHLWHSNTTVMTRSNKREVKEQFKSIATVAKENGGEKRSSGSSGSSKRVVEPTSGMKAKSDRGTEKEIKTWQLATTRKQTHNIQ